MLSFLVILEPARLGGVTSLLRFSQRRKTFNISGSPLGLE